MKLESSRRPSGVSGANNSEEVASQRRAPSSSPIGARKLELKVNGKRRKVRVPPMKRLLDTLREDLGLTGTKEGCGEGECGACTVLIDGEAAVSCLVATCQVEGRGVRTVEGLAKSTKLSRLQRAFLERGAAQCGICTPGMLMAASALPVGATLEEIRAGLAGNLCRCTGYAKIYDAVFEALRARR
jgi:aerobic-type carbon monoxide dehydrogenase small subunit (CoxS/CutS family)